MPLDELQLKAEAMLDALILQAPLKRRPALIWKGMRVSAGMAYFQLNAIGLSRHLLTDEERLFTTLVHEYAHLLAYERYGRKAAGHGVHWKQTMIELGQAPKRTHNYDVRRNKARQEVVYACQRCGATFSRARRFPRGRKYVHIHCGGALKVAEVLTATISPTQT